MFENELILSVDGGGSASRVAVFDHAGTCLEEAVVGSLSRKSSPEEVVLESLADAMRFAKPFLEKIAYSVFGLSGMDGNDDFDAMLELLRKTGFCSDDASLRKTTYGKLAKSKHDFPILLCSDAILPLFANGFQEGSVVISGTGSIALRVAKASSIERFGGWGYRTSDEGSGTWVGCEFIREALHVCDFALSGCKKSSLSKADITLVDEAYAATRTKGSKKNPKFADKCRCIRKWSMENDDPKVLASLAKRVLESKGSAFAKIRERAQEHLARLAVLALDEKAPVVVLAGGLFANKSFAAGVRKKILQTSKIGRVEIVVSKAPAVKGAYLIGKSLLNMRSLKPPSASNANVRKSMQGNKGRNTKPELVIRERLRAAGIKGYRLQWNVPGKPDIAWPGKRVAIFVNGCFWHRHEGCAMATMPKSNIEYWTVKFERNVNRDAENTAKLKEAGWTVHTVWECELAPNKIDATLDKLIPLLKEELGYE